MGRALAKTAVALVCSERTLRRYLNEGLLRGRPLEGFNFELPEQEERYAHRHWELLHGLRAALRTERDVRLAVLFGSAATDEDGDDSDIDLLVARTRGDGRSLAALHRRLGDALGRRVHLISLGDARRCPDLLADVLTEGRVIVDRDGGWDELSNEQEEIIDEAVRQEVEMLGLARAAVAAAGERAER